MKSPSKVNSNGCRKILLDFPFVSARLFLLFMICSFSAAYAAKVVDLAGTSRPQGGFTMGALEPSRSTGEKEAKATEPINVKVRPVAKENGGAK